MADKKWIQNAVSPSKKGALHKELGVPQGEKIPEAKLEKAAHAGGLEAKRANFALNVRGLKHSGAKKVKSIGDIVAKRKAKFGS